MEAETLAGERKRLTERDRTKASSLPPGVFRVLGPGLITGASDDDPSGIATYSQVGARFSINRAVDYALPRAAPLGKGGNKSKRLGCGRFTSGGVGRTW